MSGVTCRLSTVLLLLVAIGCRGPSIELTRGRTVEPDATVVPVDAGAPDGGSGGASLPGLVALRIDPPALAITDDAVSPPERGTFRAYGTFADGERDVTAEVAWTLADGTLGTAQAGTVSSASLGGKTQVEARAQGLTASAELTFQLDIVVVASGAEPGLDARFPEDTDGDAIADARALRVVYPNHETMVPRNLGSILPQWRADPSFDAFELRLESEFMRLRVVTDQRHHGLDGALFRRVADTHAGRALALSVRASSAAQGTIQRSQPITVHTSESEVLGALYYWSTGAQGVVRATLDGGATRFYPTRESGDTTCVACHTVSRDGRRIALGYGGETLRQLSVPLAVQEIPRDPAQTGPAYGWGTYGPGATRLLIANKGKLSLLDADTGEHLADVALPRGWVATFPDWSPDGKWVVMAVTTGRMGNKEAQGTSIARMAVLPDDTFGTPEIVLQSAGPEDTLCFPMFAPDSRTIAFVQTDGKSKDNPTARVFLLPADGSGPPQPLTRLNQRIGRDDLTMPLGNTMPTWAPSTTPDVFWLAFSSVRDYGDVISGQARDQIWGAALDASKIGGPLDPSFAAFWLPFQQPDEHNHRAFWALDPDQECPPGVELCDGLDNDCDGLVDDACCIPQPELCGNDVDDDCDGTVDDGCLCDAVEDCESGRDDDCDGLTDRDDEDCTVAF